MAAETLEIYARILELSRRMLASAQVERWDDLVEHEAARQLVVCQLKKHLETAVPRSTQADQGKASALIQEILKLDEETSALAERRLADVGKSLAAIGVSKQLRNTYLCP